MRLIGYHLKGFLTSILVIIFLSGCAGENKQGNPTADVNATAPEISIATQNSHPVAIRIGNQFVSVEEYEHELQRINRAVTSMTLTLDKEQQKQKVIDDLTGQLLLANVAYKEGYQQTPQEINERIEQLKTERGGEEPFRQWMTDNFLSLEEFKQILSRQFAVTWMREKLFAQFGNAADQVHARQVLVQDAAEAEAILRQLQAGADFQTLAAKYDPVTMGDLGWFPRNTLTQPELDEAVFALQPGGYSGVVKTALGYHILSVVERDPARPLNQEALAQMQVARLKAWIDEQKKTEKIELNLP